MAINFLTDGRDVYYGTSGADSVDGLGGSDTLNGRDGDDRMFGGKEGDGLFGGRGDDLLKGGADNDILNGGYGNDEIYGGDGDDVIEGIVFVEKVGVSYVPGGRDILRGGSGNDLIYASNDHAYGGAGDDELSNDLSGSDGGVATDTWLSGGSGRDKFSAGQRADGAKDISEITDFSRADNVIGILGTNGSLAIDGATGKIYDDDGDGVLIPSSFDVKKVGHDLVITYNGADQDQTIIHGGADWIHT